MIAFFSDTYRGDTDAIRRFVREFDSEGKKFDERNRNSLKLFELGDHTINIKSFKKPNLINRIVYRFFRLSKARRSFEYAHKLIEKEIGTPQPIAYFEEYTALGLKRSFYVSMHQDYDLTYRELIRDSIYVGNVAILRAFAAFTYRLHAQGIHFLDHSPGNTLIKINESGGYDFYLVDLNRMKFGALDFTTRMKNFERLSKNEAHIKTTAVAYAALSGEDADRVYAGMTKHILAFQERFYRKKRLKKKLFFWKK